jgi:hypothetical protein
MPTVLIRGMLFLSSYFPLTLIFFFLFVVQHPIWAIVILALGLSGLIIMILYFFQFAPRLGSIQEKVTALQSRDGEVMGYIASYLIPFVAIPFGGWQQGVALLIFVIVLGIVYVNSNMIHINPMLNLMGYHLYEIIVEHSERPHALITRQHIALGDTIHIIDIGDGIFLEKGVTMR